LLALKIENETTLPDGGPLSITVEGTRGIDIGRDQYLDWTLPDPSRFISGKHCEIRWHDGAYWLHDVSTNGTFLYGIDGRLKAPHKLSDGDRFSIGHYIIVAAVSGGPEAAPEIPAFRAAPDYDKLWEPDGEAAPPIDPRQLKAARDLQPVKPDFLDWAVDLGPSRSPSASPQQGSSQWDVAPRLADDAAWAQSSPKPSPPAPAPAAAVPSPRRPVWVTGEPNGPWAAPASSGAQAASPRPSASENPDLRDRASAKADSADPGSDFVRLIARGAGLPDDAFAAHAPAEFAEEVGQLLRLVAENMRQLLDARQQAKRFARSSNQTTIQALDNNPLKFAPTVEEAMRIMFGPATRSYLDAPSAIAQGFDDLKTHQIKTFSAMQHALKRLMEEFDPATIEKAPTGGRGLVGALGSSKARSWDVYATRWQARTHGHEDGMLNAFMHYFAEYYDRDGNRI
jgi:type VI secretion system protein ImpI